MDKTATDVIKHDTQFMAMSAMSRLGNIQPGQAMNYGSKSNQGQIEEFGIDSEHVVHLSMTEGMDNNWPFWYKYSRQYL